MVTPEAGIHRKAERVHSQHLWMTPMYHKVPSNSAWAFHNIVIFAKTLQVAIHFTL